MEHPPAKQFGRPPGPAWRRAGFEVIFEAETGAGKAFDVLLILSILASVVVVLLDSVTSIRAAHGMLLLKLEWTFTLMFTVEYAFRIFCVSKPLRYITSFYGLVDLLAILPTYVGLLLPGAEVLMVVRVLRVLRIFRVLKLGQYLGEGRLLVTALAASRKKITVFLLGVLTLVVILGSLMYLIESGRGGFTSIPRSIYWAVVTLTTVGYGDISPQTPLGQTLAGAIMILGYSIIAIPTGMVTAEVYRATEREYGPLSCPGCRLADHLSDARFCRRCGQPLKRTESNERP